jgi:hypothetical protein
MQQELQRLKKISRFMDSSFEGPWGVKFGLDGLLGLIPVLGDVLTTCVSLYIIVQSALLGAPASVLLRMGLNVFIENLLDSIPLIGNLFDFFWKSNDKNVALLESHSLNPSKTKFQARLVLGGIAFSLLLSMVASLAVSVLLIKKLIQLF